MKRLPTLISLFLLSISTVTAQMGINSNGDQPDASAGLDVNFSNKGFLPPRVALSAINSASPVAAPELGLLVFNTSYIVSPPNTVAPGYYYWNGTNWVSLSVDQGTNVGDMRYWENARWVLIPAGTNGQLLTFRYGHPTWGQAAFPCGTTVTVNHVAGAVAPVAKTVAYGTVTGVAGELSKCWITRNLGASQQSTARNDGSEASAGWYWQFNRKQGYKHDGTNRTPNTTWITSIVENTNWTAANDPCTIELGAPWRIPSSSEWTNVDEGGNWANWIDAWNSALKLHAAGELSSNAGLLVDRGVYGNYWSSTSTISDGGMYLLIGSPWSAVTGYYKPAGLSIRCVREY